VNSSIEIENNMGNQVNKEDNNVGSKLVGSVELKEGEENTESFI
jgi:hypothetical protein